jgi:hypothetical protein
MNIKELTELKDGWNSYNAPAPNQISIDNAKKVARILKLADFPAEVLPSGEGGIGFVFKNGDKKADIECLNNGNIIAVCYSNTLAPHSWEVAGIKATVERIKEFINESN